MASENTTEIKIGEILYNNDNDINPPQYDAAMNANTSDKEPPSYDSIINKIRNAKDTSNNSVDFFVKAISIILGSRNLFYFKT
jgi:hypothetical protein